MFPSKLDFPDLTFQRAQPTEPDQCLLLPHKIKRINAGRRARNHKWV
jgi:hypothetical protein